MMCSIGTEMPASIPIRSMKKISHKKTPSSKKETSKCRVQLPDKMEIEMKKNVENHLKKVEEKKTKRKR